jgi:phage recombination protein Bet
MTKELQKIEQSPWTPQQIKLITSTVAKGATPDELQLFLYTCKRTGLDPLTRQIHFVKRKIKNEDGTWRDQMTIQTGIDGYRVVAERSKTLAGIDDAVYDTETEQHPNKASVTIYRMIDGERVPFTASARWSEYAPQGKQAFMWNKMPYLMLAKCAEALALRKAFPNDLTGIYTNEEMGQADQPVEKDLDNMKEELSKSETTETAKAFDGEVVQNDTQKQCPVCKKWHNGRYPKCLECWKAGRSAQPTKTIINEDAPPFES